MTNMTLTTGASSLETIVGRRTWQMVTAAVLGSLFLAAMAQIQVPFFPVPMTLQTLAVMLIGLTFGFRLATATVALYLAEGALGLPVFAGFAGGPAIFLGGTAGYLVGFLAAAMAMGLMVDRGVAKSWIGRVLTLAVGQTLIFGLGIAYLASLYGFSKALDYGFYPFIAGDLLKTAIAAISGTYLLQAFARFGK